MSEVDPDFALNRKRAMDDEYGLRNGVPDEDSGMQVWDSSKGATVDGVAQRVTPPTRKPNTLLGSASKRGSRSARSAPTQRGRQPTPQATGKQSGAARRANPFHAADGAARAATVQRALAEAVERWWQASVLPNDALLRDGLLALEAGIDLVASARTLLARTALARQRGRITALRHVNDPARVASLVHEAWSTSALSAEALTTLLADKRLGTLWQRALATDLRADLPAMAPQIADRAHLGLQLIARQIEADEAARGDYALTVDSLGSSRRWVLWVVALAIVGALAVWLALDLRAPRPGDLVTIAASLHEVTALDGAIATQVLGAYAIQRTEVTNAAYGACYGAGVCPFPAQRGAATRADYFLDDNYANYPVVNVSWEAASAYCAWLEMRLPTAAEFEVAARFAPLTDRYYVWPWGDAYASAHVVDGSTFDATAEVGSRSPHGDSPLGVADLAGNVAEWTSTLAADAPQFALVKGGSYREQGADLMPARSVPVLKSSAAEWLGFRCAVTVQP